MDNKKINDFIRQKAGYMPAAQAGQTEQPEQPEQPHTPTGNAGNGASGAGVPKMSIGQAMNAFIRSMAGRWW